MLKLKNNLTEEEKKKELDKQTKMLIEETDKLYGIDRITKHGEIRRADGEKHRQKKSSDATRQARIKGEVKGQKHPSVHEHGD
jgi:stalled ribosome rescue protein Dom34